MTYSNINRDKIQTGWRLKVKNGILSLFLIVVIIASLSNVIEQTKTLNEAKKINTEIEMKNTLIKEEIENLRQKIEYATSSAYQQRRARQFLGLGNESDRWLILPQIDENINIGQKFFEGSDKPNLIKWWEMFLNWRFMLK